MFKGRLWSNGVPDLHGPSSGEPTNVTVGRPVALFRDVRFARDPEMSGQHSERLNELANGLGHLLLLRPELLELLAKVPKLHLPTRLVRTDRHRDPSSGRGLLGNYLDLAGRDEGRPSGRGKRPARPGEDPDRWGGHRMCPTVK